MIKVDVESEFAPIIGTEKQSEELVRYLMQDFGLYLAFSGMSDSFAEIPSLTIELNDLPKISEFQIAIIL
jgi:hypothetical protein